MAGVMAQRRQQEREVRVLVEHHARRRSRVQKLSKKAQNVYGMRPAVVGHAELRREERPRVGSSDLWSDIF